MGETKSCRCPQNVLNDNNNNNNNVNEFFFRMKTTKFLIHSYFKKMLNSMIICKRLRKMTDQPQMSGSLYKDISSLFTSIGGNNVLSLVLMSLSSSLDRNLLI